MIGYGTHSGHHLMEVQEDNSTLVSHVGADL